MLVVALVTPVGRDTSRRRPWGLVRAHIRVLLPKQRSNPAGSHFVITGPKKPELSVSCSSNRGFCQRSKTDYLQSTDIICSLSSTLPQFTANFPF